MALKLQFTAKDGISGHIMTQAETEIAAPMAAVQHPEKLPTRRLKITFERSLIMVTTSIALTSAIASVISTWLSARQLEAGYESIRINARNARFEQFFTAGNQFCQTITPSYVRERYFARVRENTMATGEKKLASVVQSYDLRAPLDEEAMRKAINTVGAPVDAAFLTVNFQKQMLALWSDMDLEPFMAKLVEMQVDIIMLSPDFPPGKDILLSQEGKLDGNKVARFYAEQEFYCRQTMDSTHQQFIQHHLKSQAAPATPAMDQSKAPTDKL
jgi:hypothetical protein